jgi:putative DNA primase/helicase
MTEQSAAEAATAAPPKVEVSDAFIEALVEFDPVDQEEALADLAEKHGPEYGMIARAKLRRRLRPPEVLDELRQKSAEGLRADAEWKKKQKERPADAAPVLTPRAPYEIAPVFIKRECKVDGRCILWHWQGMFYRWSGTVYEALKDDKVEAQIWEFLHTSRKRNGDSEVPFQPEGKHVSEVMKALKASVPLGDEHVPPMWLGTGEPAKDWVVFKNKVVNIIDGRESDLTPDFWAHSSLAFDWAPEMECPEWETFLGSTFAQADGSVDQEAVDFLEEFMGLCMTEQVRFHKGAIFVGKARSGKGTVSHVIKHLVGHRNYVGLSFHTWTKGEKSTQVLLNKRVGVFPDVRLKKGRHFGDNFDSGGLTPRDVEMLLTITGEDTTSIPQMWSTSWNGVLPIKLVLISNEPLNLNDPTGVLPTRWVHLNFQNSFADNPDIYLKEKLIGELGGIASRCVSAYRDLCARGKFIQPKSSEVLERQVLAASDPFTEFAFETFEVDHTEMVVKTKAYALFRAWCVKHKRLDVLRNVPDKMFGERLAVIPGFAHVRTFRPSGNQPRVWLGIRLRKVVKDED